MKKTDQLGVRWSADRKARWEVFAENMGYKPSVLASQVLEEFMACFLSEEELIALGLAQMAVTRPGPLLALALRRVPGPAPRDIDNIAEQERAIYGSPPPRARRRYSDKKR